MLANLLGQSSDLAALCSATELKGINQKIVESALQRMWVEPTTKKPEQVLTCFDQTCAMLAKCCDEALLEDDCVADLRILQHAMDGKDGEIALQDQRAALHMIEQRANQQAAVCILKTIGRAQHFTSSLPILEQRIAAKEDQAHGQGAITAAVQLLGKFQNLDKHAVSDEDLELLRSTVSALITSVKDLPHEPPSNLHRDFNAYIKKVHVAMQDLSGNLATQLIDFCGAIDSSLNTHMTKIREMLADCNNISAFNLYDLWVDLVPAGIGAEGFAKKRLLGVKDSNN